MSKSTTVLITGANKGKLHCPPHLPISSKDSFN